MTEEECYKKLLQLMMDVDHAKPFLALPEEASMQLRAMLIALDEAMRNAGVTYQCPECGCKL